ncbi:hypothetical protein [Spiroplasma taiwanense]|uniref:Uncharacterized protein n=1 Tax=Spiroplasma taiwanense CT-1 TaxID=1276220 RepID=S5MGB5_9MOLU|nr:hypothetical protein [Spiroplasma taiwanense]AGR40905.1 hypothetical protein STAIW_v1c02410 [Spiroplasma taiwanense CT-1]
MNNWPLWIILIVLVIILILYFIIPWNKIYKKKNEKQSLINEPKEYINKNNKIIKRQKF